MSDRYEIPEKIILTGNVHAMLTANEANQFNEYIVQQPLYKLLIATEANVSVLSLLVRSGRYEREDDLRKAIEESVAAFRQVGAISRKWYADLLAKDERPVQPIVGTDSHKYETQRK